MSFFSLIAFFFMFCFSPLQFVGLFTRQDKNTFKSQDYINIPAPTLGLLALSSRSVDHASLMLPAEESKEEVCPFF